MGVVNIQAACYPWTAVSKWESHKIFLYRLAYVHIVWYGKGLTFSWSNGKPMQWGNINPLCMLY